MNNKIDQQLAGRRTRNSMYLGAFLAIVWSLTNRHSVGSGLIFLGGVAVLLVTLCWSLIALIVHR
jgi:hypothetical protein